MSTTDTRAIFAAAQTDLRLMPFNNHGRTLRLCIPCNTRAEGLRVLFSNQWGEAPLVIGAASLALCDREGVLDGGALVPLTVGGSLSFELPAGEDVWSDEVRFALAPGDHLALNIYYPTSQRVTSGNWIAAGAQRSRPGNFSADLQLPGPGIISRFSRTVIVSDMTVGVTNVARIVAVGATPGRVLGCFGDSITQQSNWTEPFSRLLHHHYPGEISLCNLGIGGNRLLRPSPPSLGGMYGDAGIDRFEKDLMELPGLTHAIVAIGTNDIGLPGSNGLPVEELPTLEAYIQGMLTLAGRLKEAGVKAYVATLTPRGMVRPFDEEREAMRQAMNVWIRSGECFDGVIDFDEVLRREDEKPGMKDDCALPDELHPSPMGGMLMAKSIDLSLFA